MTKFGITTAAVLALALASSPAIAKKKADAASTPVAAAATTAKAPKVAKVAKAPMTYDCTKAGNANNNQL